MDWVKFIYSTLYVFISYSHLQYEIMLGFVIKLYLSCLLLLLCLCLWYVFSLHCVLSYHEIPRRDFGEILLDIWRLLIPPLWGL